MTAATEVMASIVPYPVHGRFLEVGSGSGVIAVTAALHGCAEVTAVDISEAAVANTKANAARHFVADRVEAGLSDLFQGVSPDRRFDVIFWNVPWTYVHPGYSLRSSLHAAVFDPGYQNQARYIAEGPRYLAPNGRLFIGTADLGERDRLDELANAAGRRILPARVVRRQEVHRLMEYQLLEVLPR
ncbi:hypothetical protein GCM10023321_79800 [Pseudonocardia eucalypti]|uniref:Methyltransferase domain-containing protein n=2 Tax=Pseudonocardia eucalypti TaxID=648755 RepID=A0ABP9RCM7_9PSEU|nr:methylase of polypeptide subunit release factors [Pseudonocardia eucalypti]